MTEKEFLKEIKSAIKLSVYRFYIGLDFEGYEKVRDTTIRSLFYEYKKYFFAAKERKQ